LLWRPRIGERSSSPMNRWTNLRHECVNGGKHPVSTGKTSGSCDTVRRAQSADLSDVGRGIAPSYSLCQLCCARILLSVLRTLLHGAFQWLQPRSPVVEEAVERGRGPDPPDARVALGSVRLRDALAALGSRRAGGSQRDVGRENHPVVKAGDANPRRGRQADVSVGVLAAQQPWLA